MSARLQNLPPEVQLESVTLNYPMRLGSTEANSLENFYQT